MEARPGMSLTPCLKSVLSLLELLPKSLETVSVDSVLHTQ